MATFTLEKHFQAPPAKVFEVVTDLRRAPERIRGITRLEVLTEGPIRQGTRFRETRVMFKREATEEMEITAFDPPRGYSVGCESCGCRYRTDFRLTPSRGGTDVRLEFEAVPLTFFAKAMSFLFKPMIKSCLKAMEQDLEDLRAAVEPGPNRGASASARTA